MFVLRVTESVPLISQGMKSIVKISNFTWKYRGDNQYQNAPIKYRGDNHHQNAPTVFGIEGSGSELERLPDFVTIRPLTLNREKLKEKHFVDILKNAIFK